MEREYGEMIYSMLSEMNGVFMTQVRQINNNMGNIQRIMLDLNTSISNLIAGLKESRDKRYQEEIDSLEQQMETLRKQLEEKKSAKSSGITTSQKIRSVVMDVAKEQKLAEVERTQIDWIDVRNKVLIVVITAVVIWLLPHVGAWLQLIFAPK